MPLSTFNKIGQRRIYGTTVPIGYKRALGSSYLQKIRSVWHFKVQTVQSKYMNGQSAGKGQVFVPTIHFMCLERTRKCPIYLIDLETLLNLVVPMDPHKRLHMLYFKDKLMESQEQSMI